MRTLRVRLELNKGRKGIPLHKLAAVTEEVQRFFQRVGSDLGVPTPREQWLAVRFRNGSVSFDAEYQGQLTEERIEQYNAELGGLIRAAVVPSFESRLSPATVLQFARIAEPIDEDEQVRFGLYQNGGARPVEWHALTKAASRQLAHAVVASNKYRGVVQGIAHSWYKEASPPYFYIRQSVTQSLVKCLYDKTQYSEVLHLFEKRNAVVQVIGMITANMIERRVDEVDCEKFAIAEELSDEDFERFFGMAPDLTGNLTTEEYISLVRENGHEA